MLIILLSLFFLRISQGPYTTKLFVDELGAPSSSLQNNTPLPNFGDHHPDPNLTYADELVREMYTEKYQFGAAFDGDGVTKFSLFGKDSIFAIFDI